MSFSSLGLCPALLRALDEQGYVTPTPIQSAAIPVVLAGQDVMAGAQTGTGKTAAFALPLLHQLSIAPAARTGPRVLVLVPTRELAAQVHEDFRTYGKHLKISAGVVYGGVGMQPQVDLLRRGVEVLIATPGRLIDHLERRTLRLDGIQHLVLDEADRMLDMGFLPAMKRILNSLPKNRQTLLYSATFAPEVKSLAQSFLRQPVTLQVSPQNSGASTVEHRMHPIDAGRKLDLLLHLLAEDSRRQTLLFVRTKHGADKLVRKLVQYGHRAAAIHGNKSQSARLRVLDEFKRGQVVVLVATDIAARGIDIEQLPVVINFDLPMVAADYVHRIGRTGRAGASGLALSLLTPDDRPMLREIERLLGRSVPVEAIANLVLPTQVTPDPAPPAAPPRPGPKSAAPRRRRRKPASNARAQVKPATKR